MAKKKKEKVSPKAKRQGARLVLEGAERRIAELRSDLAEAAQLADNALADAAAVIEEANLALRPTKVKS